MNNFSVSVIIPVYNAENFIEQAVESALQQPEVGEVVLVDDGSTDRSPTLANQLLQRYPNRISFYSHPEGQNLGPGSTRNLGLAKARCEYIAFLDADDWYLPGYFAEAAAAFAADPELGLVRHPLGNAWDADDPEQAWFPGYTGKDRAEARFHSQVIGVDAADYFCNLYPLGEVSSGIAGTLTLKRSLALAAGGFPPRHWAEDTTFHLKAAAIGKVAFADMETPLAMRRIHEANLSKSMADKLATRVDATGLALLDLASFTRRHKLALKKRRAIHRGWLRYGRLYRSLSPLAMLRRDPIPAFSPRLIYSYTGLTAWIAVRYIWRTFRRLAGVDSPPT